MKKSKFTKAQIVFALKQAETGSKVDEVYSKRTQVQVVFADSSKPAIG